MFEIFQSTLVHPFGKKLPPEFDYVKLSYLRELLNYQDYYNSRVYAVKNQNFLVRLLMHVDTPLNYDIQRFVEVTRTRAPYLAKAFRMTSEINYGDIHNGCFFGPGTDEVIIYEDTYFDPVYAEKNWRRINAVTTLYHPRSDLGFMLPNGRASSSDTGMAFISINLPLLAVQLRSFFKDQFVNRYMQDGSSLGIPHFVHMYVLPNMMYHHTNVVIMNRLMRLLYNEDMGKELFKHPFPILHYNDKLDNVLIKVIDNYYDSRVDYADLLASLPSIDSKDASVALRVPDMGSTRQVKWALVLSRLKIMKFLIDLAGEHSINTNRTYITHLKGTLKRMKGGAYVDILPYELVKEVEAIMDEIQAL